jgi:hypothetical protein
VAGDTRVEDIEALVDPFKGYQFQMTITPKGAAIGGQMTQIMSLRCTATEIPGIGIDQVPVDLAGFTLEYSGRARFHHTWTTTLVEGVDGDIQVAIASWMKLCYNWITGKGGNKKDISSTAAIQQYDNPGTKTIKTTLYGVFPIGNPAIALSMAESRAVAPSITWSFDYTDIDKISDVGTINI